MASMSQRQVLPVAWSPRCVCLDSCFSLFFDFGYMNSKNAESRRWSCLFDYLKLVWVSDCFDLRMIWLVPKQLLCIHSWFDLAHPLRLCFSCLFILEFSVPVPMCWPPLDSAHSSGHLVRPGLSSSASWKHHQTHAEPILLCPYSHGFRAFHRSYSCHHNPMSWDCLAVLWSVPVSVPDLTRQVSGSATGSWWSVAHL